jgi:CO dehydrogenase/acetyl-CoA synthase epsilon subunit
MHEIDSSITHSQQRLDISSPSHLQDKLQERVKQMEEQESIIIIKTLSKQLTLCEADLQAHMDLVNNLESSLGDSEKNRKTWSRATRLD